MLRLLDGCVKLNRKKNENQTIYWIIYILDIFDNRMYQIVKRTVVFNWDFNQVLNDAILNDIASCDKIIFNNCRDLNICLRLNNKYAEGYYYAWYGSRFNKSLDNLPSSIIDLDSGSNFNKSLDNLPFGIINLTLGFYFNQEIDNLPHKIRNLTLGTCFNQCLDNLPSSIINLTLGYCFNQCLDNLPHSINKITFEPNSGYYIDFNQEIKKIPRNLTLIDLSRIPNKSHLKKEFEKFNVEIIE
jgi:hypothetical protein